MCGSMKARTSLEKSAVLQEGEEGRKEGKGGVWGKDKELWAFASLPDKDAMAAVLTCTSAFNLALYPQKTCRDHLASFSLTTPVAGGTSGFIWV